MQKVLVSGFIFENGKVLLLKRGEKKFLPNHWEMPGGKLEFGEDPVCGVLRETKEEAGLEAEVICPYYCWHAMDQYKGEPAHFVEIDFILKIKPNQKIKPADGMVDCKWATEKELDGLLISPEMKVTLKKGFEWHKNLEKDK